MNSRPHTTVVLAMSVDGKIADFRLSPARFGSEADIAHLKSQIAIADAVLLGAGTLRAYGTTLTLSEPELIKQRTSAGKPAQPIHIVITESTAINPEIKFFRQPIERWLFTTTMGAKSWQESQHTTAIASETFTQTITFDTPKGKVDIAAGLEHLASIDITRIAVLGGGELVASMLEADLIDELWLTVCPLILGGNTAPTPVGGRGFLSDLAPKLELLEVHQVGQEIFLHYRLQ